MLISENRKNVTRGLHYQNPYPQSKIVWCTKGAVYDVFLDLRQGSPTFGKWHGLILSAKEDAGVYLPKGLAHGFQAIEDNSAILYLLDEQQISENERGIRWDDPDLGIAWPAKKGAILSEKDRGFPFFKKAEKFR